MTLTADVLLRRLRIDVDDDNGYGGDDDGGSSARL